MVMRKFGIPLLPLAQYFMHRGNVVHGGAKFNYLGLQWMVANLLQLNINISRPVTISLDHWCNICILNHYQNFQFGFILYSLMAFDDFQEFIFVEGTRLPEYRQSCTPSQCGYCGISSAELSEFKESRGRNPLEKPFYQ